MEPLCQLPHSSGFVCGAASQGLGVRFYFSSLASSFPKRPEKADSSEFSADLTSSTDKLFKRNDFLGVPAQVQKEAKSSDPDIIIASILLQASKNFRVRSEDFLENVLCRIESRDPCFLETLRRSSARYVPSLIRICGNPLSDLSNNEKQVVLDRLLSGLEGCGVNHDIDAFNATIAVYNEIDHDFNAWDMLERADRLCLKPDAETFHLLISRLAVLGDLPAIREMSLEAGRRGIILGESKDYSLIYCCAVRGMYSQAEAFVERALGKYGDEAKGKAFASYVRALAARQDIDALRKVLRRAVVSGHTARGLKLCIPHEDVLETIWLLTKCGIDGDGREHEALCAQMLELSEKQKGFFKHLTRNVEKHISHSKFHSAVTILEESNRVKECLENQQRTSYLVELMSRLANRMIVTGETPRRVKEIVNRLSAAFRENEVRFADSFMYAALTCRYFSADRKLEYFSELVDVVDPARERIHIILPLLTSAESLSDRLKMLFSCISLGYKNTADLDIRMLSHLFLNSIYEEMAARDAGGKADRVGGIARLLNSFSVPPKETWNILMEWLKLKTSCSPGYNIEATELELKSWLRKEYDVLFGKKSEMKYKPEASFSKLKELLDLKKAVKVHSFLKTYGFPQDTDFETVVDPILDLYFKQGEWNSLIEMLNLLSTREQNNEAVYIKNYHLIQILAKHIARRKKCCKDTIELAYELRRLFPQAVYQSDNYYETTICVKRAVLVCFEARNQNWLEQITGALNFIRAMVKLKILELHREETVSDIVVDCVLKKLGYDDAIVTWVKLYSLFETPNGIVRLLKYAYSSTDTRAVHLLLHRAYSVAKKERIDAINAAVLVKLQKLQEAEEIFVKEKLPLFEVLCAFRLIAALDYKRRDVEFIFNFLRLTLRHTELSKDIAYCCSFHSTWLKTCEHLSQCGMALRIYALFKEYDQHLNSEYLRRVLKLVEDHQNTFRKWVLHANGLLNIEKTKEFDFVEAKAVELQYALETAIAAEESTKASAPEIAQSSEIVLDARSF